jgi:Xaa-Pro aminopeptidase
VAKIVSSKALPAALAKLGKGKKAVLIDPASAPEAIASTLKEAGAALIEKRDPVLLPKSRKNEGRTGRHARGA